jgi:hypothetical protein
MTLSRLLDTVAYITGTVDQELLLRNEYLVAESRILKAQLKGRPRLSDAERARLCEIGHRLGRQALVEVATAPLPDTSWHGTEGWSLANLMDRGHVEPQAGRRSTERLRN